ncbi:sulfite exporter TauE/SafE family protein [Streptomonospora wellingtoniae]|uniref:Probable membrane transporter protein n=1 Tax=Streptomonospora wellingtoniae TaxID=3075544 RepID=A0ABU2KUB7_9ACTN|nr:sulfite exporter TauE/SafE family protein [Streptomonospora sp. DSM 45055]MDT0302847.1 sulfite exporter TauE/SafE family protein [Streptomonospora sp. DSM 45055]
MPELSFILVAGTAVLLGAVVQTSVGLGLGLLAAPVVALLEPSLMPGAMLIATCVLPAFTVAVEWRGIDRHGLLWALVGRTPGAVAGVWLVATAAPEAIAGGVGAMVLVAVVLSVREVRVRIRRRSLLAAGLVSGFTGTATSIGGPPVALLYQHESADRIRGTLGAYFLVSTLMSLCMLAVGGELHAEEVAAGLWLMPFVVAGFLAGRPLCRVIDAGRMRAALLIVVTVSGAVLLAQSVLG